MFEKTDSQIWVHGRKCSGWMLRAWHAHILPKQCLTLGLLLTW